jgi:hypothetical protein
MEAQRTPEPDQFSEYFGIFVASGKALNRGDMERACREWVSLGEQDRLGAIEDARKTCMSASGPAFVPFPSNHLRAKGWTRVALPRTLPAITAKETARADKALDLIEDLKRLQAARRAAGHARGATEAVEREQ